MIIATGLDGQAWHSLLEGVQDPVDHLHLDENIG